MINYPEWYNTPQVKFRMISFTYNREVMFINQNMKLGGMTTRMIRIHNVQGFDVWFKALYIYEKMREYNLYYSLARYKDGIPFRSLALDQRDFGDWAEENWKEMVSFDFLLDVDAGNHKEIDFAFYSAKEIKNLFDKLEVPYHLRFSGRGFHFLIPFEFFPVKCEGLTELHCFNPESDYSIYNIYRDIATELNKRYSEMIDTTIYDSRRVTKIPYSLALYGGNNYVCISFDSDEDFENFSIGNMTPVNQYHRVTSVNRWKEHLFNPDGKLFKLLKELKIK